MSASGSMRVPSISRYQAPTSGQEWKLVQATEGSAFLVAGPGSGLNFT